MKPMFNKIKINRPGRNLFDMSHEKKLSMSMGELIPMFLQETVPGDKFRVNSEIFLRLAPMIAPVMHRVNVYTHFFFVPYRLIWEDWEKFITGGVDGTEAPAFPYISLAEADRNLVAVGTLADYLGVPAGESDITTPNTYPISALPFRAYQLIWNEYYRDQTLQDPAGVLKTSGTITALEKDAITTLRRRCWEKDYFTSALPFAQRGPAVQLPADIQYDTFLTLKSGGNPATGPVTANNTSGAFLDNNGNAIDVENIDSLGVTINDLRRATRLQSWLERNARAGSRYVEQIFSHFGVKSSDARLQRPEFLGGSKQPVVMSEVLNTSGAGVQGNMAGHGVSVGSGFNVNKFFEEHGFVVGIMSVLPRTAYMQGLPRIFNKFDKFDYFFPEFANIGEQEVKNREIYWNTDPAGENPAYNEETFGYQSRYAEYKFVNSSVHGDFRSNLNYWHMARLFGVPPTLNEDFVASDPTKRIFAVDDPNIDDLYVQIYHDFKAIRPMPVFGTPTL